MNEPNYQDLIGQDKSAIDTPALLIDLDIMEENIRKMADFFAGLPARCRPHAKTHKCPEIARRQLEAGAIGITCAKLGEAEVMAGAGIRDILIANEIVGKIKIQRLMELARRADVMVAVDDPRNVADLSAAAQSYGSRLRVLVEVNIGHNRCGVEPGEAALALVRQVLSSPGLRFMGLQGYEGHVVLNKDREQREAGCKKSLELLLSTRDLIRRQGIDVEVVSTAGTGTYYISATTPGVTEVQPGSYVLMDTTYGGLGLGFGCALRVLSTVISRPNARRAIADAGMKTMTGEFGLPQLYDRPGVRLDKLSEEHAILALEEAKLDVGDRVEFLPSHVCTTVNLHDRFYALREGKIEAVWAIAGRGKAQ